MPLNFRDCINCAIRRFYERYSNSILQLLHSYPKDMETNFQSFASTHSNHPMFGVLQVQDHRSLSRAAACALLQLSVTVRLPPPPPPSPSPWLPLLSLGACREVGQARLGPKLENLSTFLKIYHIHVVKWCPYGFLIVSQHPRRVPIALVRPFQSFYFSPFHPLAVRHTHRGAFSRAQPGRERARVWLKRARHF